MYTSLIGIIDFLRQEIEIEQPHSILDISIKEGLCEKLARDMDIFNMDIDGVLGIEHKKEGTFYNKVYVQPIEEIVTNLEKYDVILCLDILKKLSMEKRIDIIKELLLHTNKYILICNSIGAQGEDEGRNESSLWNIVDLKEFDFVHYRLQDNDTYTQVIKIFPPKEKYVKNIDYTLLQNLLHSSHRKLNITYILPHKKLTGGLKMLLLQIEQLKLRGHKVNVMLKADNTVSALPEFYSIEVDNDIVIPLKEKYTDYISNEDIIVASFFTQLEELELCRKPVLYWEQGSEQLFGDLFKQESEANTRGFLERAYRTSTHIVSVSSYVQEVLVNKYGRYTRVLPSYIDTKIFIPIEKKFSSPKECTILLVGNPKLSFKGLDLAIQALETIWRMGYPFQVKWIIPSECEKITTSFPVEYIYSPEHKQLVKQYQESDILLWTSWYEGFGMPPLEAMAAGKAVISTRCGGVDTYAEHLVNSILVNPGDIRALIAGVIFLLTKEELRINLGIKGRETALRFSYERGIAEFEAILYTIVEK
ncbi:glycosyltransferase family 4 protein [Bacillus manliponensis]|uniref:glycosyltransferase family 4 protein n=1 Tax=Bacillus manliponensis TaxID=574376 RepID=UPI003511448F